jgi:hypothetical protein
MGLRRNVQKEEFYKYFPIEARVQGYLETNKCHRAGKKLQEKNPPERNSTIIILLSQPQ